MDDEHFNLLYHVRHTALPRPGEDRQLKRLAARIVSQPLDRTRPLWEIWIVEGLGEGDHFAMINKTHHCMIDGIAGAELLRVLLRDSPNEEFEEAADWIPRPAPDRATLFREEVQRRARAPFSLLGNLPKALRQPGKTLSTLREDVAAIAEAVGAQSHKVSELPFNKPIGPHRRFDWLPMGIGELKEVGHAMGGSLNDVVLATVTGAVRRFLEHRRVHPEGLDIRAFVPVSTRAGRDGPGNHVAAWNMPLPVDARDPGKRLARITAETARLKKSRMALGTELLEELTEWGSTALLAVGLQLASKARTFNLVVTNVPGPPKPLFLLGAPLRECYPLVPLYGTLGLGIALFSYAGNIYWGFNADWDQLPDLHDFVEALEASFRELQEAAREAPPAEAAPRNRHEHRRRERRADVR